METNRFDGLPENLKKFVKEYIEVINPTPANFGMIVNLAKLCYHDGVERGIAKAINVLNSEKK